MRSPSTRLLTAVLAGGLTICGSVCLAQEGVYAVSDSQPPAPAPEAQVGTTYTTSSPQVIYGGTYDCDCEEKSGCCLLRGGKIYSRGGEWHPPQPNPIHRASVVYQRYLPQVPYGSGPMPGVNNAPMVYQPTDTTQLGFTYQHVPTWRPNPNMIPSPPFPEYYHSRHCRSRGACQTIPAGSHIIYESPTPAQTAPSPQEMSPIPATPPPAPAPQELNKSASSWNPIPVRS